MLKIVSLISFVVLSAGCSFAQEPKLTTGDLQAWVRSGDPRRIAWAAHYAAEYGESAYPGTLEAMKDALDKERTTMEPNALAPAASEHDHAEAVAAVLDTFIRQNATLPPGIITNVSGRFPAQALILASHLPPMEKKQLLQSWYELRNGSGSGRLLARVATLMLADKPPSALAASVVSESEEHLTVVLRRRPKQPEGFGSNTCGDSASLPVRSDWPVVYTYQLEENATDKQAVTLVALEGERITYRRLADNAPGGSCNDVADLNPETRHRLIAYWLGIPEHSMPWSVQSFAFITWTTKAAYLNELGRVIEQHREMLQGTIDALKAKRVLDSTEAASVQPRLMLSFVCEVKPCPIQMNRN